MRKKNLNLSRLEKLPETELLKLNNEYNEIIKDMSDEEFEELKIQFEQAVANIKDHNQENHSILILNDLIEEYRDE